MTEKGKKYKVRTDPKIPTDAEIASHKDFGKVMLDYKRATHDLRRRPLYKDPKLFLGLLLIIIIAWLIFMAVEEENTEKTPVPPEKPKTEQPISQPPGR